MPIKRRLVFRGVYVREWNDDSGSARLDLRKRLRLMSENRQKPSEGRPSHDIFKSLHCKYSPPSRSGVRVAFSYIS